MRTVVMPRLLVISTRQAFKQEILDIAVTDPEVEVDARGTTYIDSSGLGVLVSVSKKLKDYGGRLRVVGLNDDLMTLFELTQLDKLVAVQGRDHSTNGAGL